jgi:CHAT domain-containing protein/tetratricopeptide (TPR) repeat protein
MDTPILVLRPGDPIECVVALPTGTAPDGNSGVIADLVELAGARLAPVAFEPIAPIPLDRLAEVIDRYSGFVLVEPQSYEESEGWSDRAIEWVDAARELIAVPDILAEINRFALAASEAGAREIAHASGGLLARQWRPVRAWAGEALAEAQEDEESKALIRNRLNLLSLLEWPEAAQERPGPPAAPILELLGRASASLDQTLTARQDALNELIEALRADGTRPDLLVGALISLQATAFISSDRSPADIEMALRAGAEAIPLAADRFGPIHPVTIRATQDRAAILLDYQDGDPIEHREEAIALLWHCAEVTAAEGSTLIVDVMQNLAAAYAHRQREGRTDNQERAIRIFEDAAHLLRQLDPYNARSKLQIKVNAASTLRERRVGDRETATRRVLEIYRDIVADASMLSNLTAIELVNFRSNYATARFQLSQLAPSSSDLGEVTALCRVAVEGAMRLAVGEPVRLSVLSNCGSILGDLYQDDFADTSRGPLLEEAIGLTGLAYEEAIAVLGPHHGERLRLGLNHAANLGRPIPSGKRYDTLGAEAVLLQQLGAEGVDNYSSHVYALTRNLGQLYAGVGRWEAAATSFERAVNAVDALYRDARRFQTKLAEIGVTSGESPTSLTGWAVNCWLQAEEPDRAIQVIERSRARLLSDVLAVPLVPAVDTGEVGPVLYVGVGTASSWIILCLPSRPPEVIVTSLREEDLRPDVVALREAQRSGGSQEHSALAWSLDALAERLMPTITAPVRIMLETYRIDDIAVVASGLLSGLPLHALPTDPSGEGCWLDVATVRYIPSAGIQNALALRERHGERGSAIVVSSAEDELDFGRYEPDIVERSIGDVARSPQRGVGGWLRDRLASSSVLHVASHTRWNPTDPLSSVVTVGARPVLSLGELIELPDLRLELAVFSSCATGISNHGLADELVGFGTAVLIAGARSAVVSNWLLGDLSATLVTFGFYTRMASGAEAAVALRGAQQWVAGLTNGELGHLAEEVLSGSESIMPRGLAAELSALRFSPEYADTDDRPFRHPARWAGLSYYGPRKVGI